MSKQLIKLLPLAAALALSGMAHAGGTTELPSVVVRYSDLDLNTKSDVARLHARLRSAAKQVCTPLESRGLGIREQFDACVSDAVAHSVAEVANPNLTRFHRYGRHGDLSASS